jgi:merozoite surface protein 4
MSAARNKLVLTGTIAALAFGSLGAAGVAQARHGADDPAGHNAGDDHGGRAVRAHAARHGRDDRAGDDRGGLRARTARHGSDDGPGHDAGDDHGGR